jgi:UDPglucose 6-dehydrogenase
VSPGPVIGYAGLTHLGLLSGLAAAAKGFTTVGYDPDATLVGEVGAGQFRIVEPGLDELFAQAGPCLTVTADIEKLSACDVVYIAIDVPTDTDNRSDVRPVGELLLRVAHVAKPGASIVVLSQVQPGFTRAARVEVEQLGGPRLFYQVETLVFGRAVERAMQPERYILGLAVPDEPLPEPLQHYLSAFGCPILPMRYESAELCKISINMFLVSSVSTTNMLAEICEGIGADWREIAPALRLDRRIGPHAYLTPGLGVGGGNLTRDLATIAMLAAEHGTDAGIVSAWLENTRHRRDWVLRVLHDLVLADVPDARVAVWGLAYKENTQFTKNSPALDLIARLPGIDTVAYDPAARPAAHEVPAWLRIVPSSLAACAAADALAVMTPWDEFARADLAAVKGAMRGRVLIDPFGIIDPGLAAQAGFLHRRLGRGEADSTC